MTTDARLAARRDDYFARALEDSGVRRFYEEMRYRPPHAYRSGLVVPDEHGPEVGVIVGQPRVFDAAEARLGLLDEVLGTGWVLLGVGVPAEEVESARRAVAALDPAVACIAVDDRLPSGAVRALVDVDGRLDQEFAAYRGRLLLIRPDHFVAASWSSGNAPAPAALHLAGTPAAASALVSA